MHEAVFYCGRSKVKSMPMSLIGIKLAATDTNTPLVLMQLELCGGGCTWWCKVYTVQIVDYWKPTVHSIPTGSDRKFLFIKLCFVCLVLN